MFASEKELVDVLVQYLQEKHNIKYIVKELRSGNNIADVVYTKDINMSSVIFNEYEESYKYVRKIYNEKSIELSQLMDFPNPRSTKKLLKKLESQGYISIEGSRVKIIKRVEYAMKDIVAIEAKLSDWRNGLIQAIRYKAYSTHVYVAISEKYLKNVDIDLLKEENIGLFSVSNNGVKKIVRPRYDSSWVPEIKYYIEGKMLSKLDLI